MKVVAPQALLTKTLRRCMLGGTGSALNPIHALVRVEARQAEGDDAPRLILSATIGTMAINTSMLARVEKPGVAAFNARELTGAASFMPEGPLTLATTDKRVKLTGSSGRTWSGGVMDPEGIRPPPEPKSAPWVRIPTEKLRVALERVSFATSDVLADQHSRDGVRIEAEGEKLTAICCSEHMFVVTEQQMSGIKAPWQALIPTMTLAPLKDIMEEAEEDAALMAAAGGEAVKPAVDLYTDGSFLYVVGPATLLVAALPIGDYPPWRLLLESFPKEAACTLPRLVLMESLKACQATAAKLTPGSSFRLKDHNVCVFRKDKDTEFEETMPLVSMRPGLDMIFKAQFGYMLPCLKSADVDPEFLEHANGMNILLRTPTYMSVIALMDSREDPK